MTDIDWFAVECVVNGTRLVLNKDEKKAVIRRLEHRMTVGNHGQHKMHGQLSTQDVAWLMGCTDRNVDYIKGVLPPAEKHQCRVCGSDMWVAEGFIEPHGDHLFNECPASRAIFDGGWESELASTTVWLSRRLRSGDTQGVWEYLERMSEGSLRPLLVAALAGVSDADDPFEWLEEDELPLQEAS